MGRIMNFYNDVKIVKGRASGPEDAVTNNLECPASGSYVDVSGYEWVNIVVELGALADAVVITPKCSDAEDGTADDIDATNFAHTCSATADDDQLVVFTLETAKLPEDHHFVTVKFTGISGTDYATVLYYLGGARHPPVTQSDSLPSAHAYEYAG
jgi:hypothetical protein